MEQVSSLIAQNIKTAAETEDYYLLWPKRKAITALLPYAVWRERDGEPEMLNAILHAARAAKRSEFMWYRVNEIASMLFSKASPRAIVLTSPHIHWHQLTDTGGLVQQLAVAASAVPYTEEIGQNVVDALLQIACNMLLSPHIPMTLWLWLTKQPSLPPVCNGRVIGSWFHVVDTVRALKDVEILKSYFLLVWSEWNEPEGISGMHDSIKEDLSGTEMGSHRAELIQRLDYVMEQLDRGSEYLDRHNPMSPSPKATKRRYTKLKETLLEVERCMSSQIIAPFDSAC